LISRTVLNERVQEWQLREEVVEKDYVIGWVLWGIGSNPRLSTAWAFKGGTCLKKCHIETYRFSEDLDFSVLPGGLVDPGEIADVLGEILSGVYEESGIDFSIRSPMVRLRPDGNSLEGRIYYRGPRGAPGVASIKLDITIDEKVIRPTALNPISHPYPDELPAPGTVRCYAFDELFAEKIRAMGERCRPRDLYDIVFLFRQESILPYPESIHLVHEEKCKNKGLEVTSLATLESSPYREEIEREWENMLGHQLPSTPPFDHYWQELPNLFAWLDGSLLPKELTPISHVDANAVEWSPPPTAWVWGRGVPLEVIRYAATNHLCIELGYNRDTRVVEPYSLRKTKDDNLLFYAVKTDSGELRAYRVDRIESIQATKLPFKPRFAVEFTSEGPFRAPPTQRSADQPTKRRKDLSGVNYVIECTSCGKRFRRSKSDSKLRPHKAKGSDWQCPGRVGYLVDHYL